MEAIFSAETLVATYKSTWHYNLENRYQWITFGSKLNSSITFQCRLVITIIL
jgi:hypothetical protein